MKGKTGSKTRTRFESIGTYLPEKVVSTKELMSRGKADFFKLVDLEGITGIVNRRVHSDSEDSYTLSVDAARDCLENSRYKAEDLDIIIYSAITQVVADFGFLHEPAMSLLIKKGLGAKSALHLDIANGCAGMLTGAYILDSMIKTGAIRTGMVVSGEAITGLADSAIIEISNVFDEQFASLTLGDAGAAFIMDESQDDSEGIDFCYFMTIAEHAELCIGLPGGQGNGIVMYTKAREIHEAAIDMICPILDRALTKYGKKISDIDYYLPHQTSVRAMWSGAKRFAEYFNVDIEWARDVFLLVNVTECGNTASTTHFVAMHRFLKENKFKKGTRVIFAAHASGLVLGYVLATLGDMEASHRQGD